MDSVKRELKTNQVSPKGLRELKCDPYQWEGGGAVAVEKAIKRKQ